MEEDFVIEIRRESAVEVTLATLPSRPTVIAVAPRPLE
jgi:hypothetical protein